MTDFNFEDDFVCAPKVKSAYLEDANATVYWLNGTGRDHSQLMKMIGDDKTRQEGWGRSVFQLAANENGKPRYKGNVEFREFLEKMDHTVVRNYGMLILGISKGDEPSDFESEVRDEVKKSEKAKGGSNS